MAEILDKVEKTVGKVAKRGIVGEFRDFINRGNVVDVAVAFVMGAAFKTVVDSFAGSGDNPGILGGFIGAIFGGQQPDFSQRFVSVHGSRIPVGSFVTASINFFFVAIALFIVVKVYNRFRDKDEQVTETHAETTDDLLRQIRDELRASRGE